MRYRHDPVARHREPYDCTRCGCLCSGIITIDRRIVCAGCFQAAVCDSRTLDTAILHTAGRDCPSCPSTDGVECAEVLATVFQRPRPVPCGCGCHDDQTKEQR